MSALPYKELHLLLDRSGALIVFQEKDASWAGLLAFTSEELARRFCALSRVQVAEFAALAADDRESIAALVRDVKGRAVRNLLLDLDYATGKCLAIEFEGDQLSAPHEKQFEPRDRAAGAR